MVRTYMKKSEGGATCSILILPLGPASIEAREHNRGYVEVVSLGACEQAEEEWFYHACFLFY